MYNQLLGIKLRIFSLWRTSVYFDTESLCQRNLSYTRTLAFIFNAPLTGIENLHINLITKMKKITLSLLMSFISILCFSQEYEFKKWSLGLNLSLLGN